MNGKGYGRKLIAPIIITVIACGWLLLWLAACLLTPGLPLWGKLIGGIIPLAFCGVIVYILVERIREIRSGEEDDLSQY